MASPETSYSPKVQKRSLRGHKQPVLCISHPNDHLKYSTIPDGQKHHHPSLLLSGSEDGTARLWDLRTRKTANCIIVPTIENEPNDVTAVAFHPSIIEGSDTMSGEGYTRDCMIYASSGTNVYGYDLRSCTGPIIRSPPQQDLSSSFQCLDEINQFSFSFPKSNKSGQRHYQMATVDDCGEVHIPSEYISQSISQQSASSSSSSSSSSKQTVVLHHAEPGSHTIASSAVFRPRVNGTFIASGGTDCVVKLFDVSKPKRATSSIHIKPTQSENTTQLCNPPFVHSLQWSPSGRLLAAGVGDGSCVILRGEGNRLVEIGRLGYDEGGHGSAVAAVCFPGFGSSAANKLGTSVEAEDRLLVSAGNDGKILFWDLGGNMVDGSALDPMEYLAGCRKVKEDAKTEAKELKSTTEAMNSIAVSSSKKGKGKNKKKGSSKNQKAVTDDDLFLDDLLPSPPKVLFQIPHRHKPNWITCSRASDDALPSSVFVADTTNDISVYSLPH